MGFISDAARTELRPSPKRIAALTTWTDPQLVLARQHNTTVTSSPGTLDSGALSPTAAAQLFGDHITRADWVWDRSAPPVNLSPDDEDIATL